FSPDGRLLALASFSGIRICDTTSWQVRSLTNSGWGRSMAFTRDNALIVTYRFSLCRYDLATGAKMSVPGDSFYQPQSLALAGDGSKLAVSTWTGDLELRDTRSLELLGAHKVHRSAFHGIAWSPEGKTLATGGFDQDIHLVEAATGKVLETLRGHLN